MKEDSKKFSLLSNLNNILSNHYINNKVFKYKFYYMHALIINDIEYKINNDMVVITLYLDEFIVEIYDNKEKLQKSLTLPYNAIEEVYILLED